MPKDDVKPRQGPTKEELETLVSYPPPPPPPPPPEEPPPDNEDEEQEGADEKEQDLEEYPPAAKKAKLPGPAPDPESDLNLPPDLSLDEVEAVKKRLKFGSSVDRNFTAKIANPSGKLDLRGRPIPGMASMPTDKIRPQEEEEEENVGHNEEQPSTSSGLTGAAQEHLMKMAGVERRTVASVGGGTMQRRRQEGGDGYWTTESNPEATKMPKPKPCKKLFVNGLPASMTEDSLFKHFSYYGTVTSCNVVRNHETGISRGFAFVNFATETEAEGAVANDKHVVDGREIRVNMCEDKSDPMAQQRGKVDKVQLLEGMILPVQSRIYVGPLEENVGPNALSEVFAQFGTVSNVSRFRAHETSCKRGFGVIEYKEGPRAVCRAFGAKVVVQGRTIEIALSRIGMELILTPTAVFFFDAYDYCPDKPLENYFMQFGQIFRAAHMLHRVPPPDEQRRTGWEPPVVPNKSYGFVDFIDPSSVGRVLHFDRGKTHLIHPGQYIKVAKVLPIALLLDLCAIGEQEGLQIQKKLEKVSVTEGSWGNNKKVYVPGATTSQVRIPKAMISRLIGERGRTVLSIARDSKTKINIPPNIHNSQDKNVVVEITGKKEDIKTAQYLMQKLLKGQR